MAHLSVAAAASRPVGCATGSVPPKPNAGMKESAMSEQQRGTTSTTRAAAAGTRLDPWYNTYADRALGMRQSEVRSLFAVANRPEVVSLAGGMPNIEGLPLEFLAEMSARLLRDRGTSILQYGSGQGNAELREMIAEGMRPDGAAIPTTSPSPPVRSRPSTLSPRSSSTQATSSWPKPPRTSAHWGPSGPTRLTSSMCRWTATGSFPKSSKRRSNA